MAREYLGDLRYERNIPKCQLSNLAKIQFEIIFRVLILCVHIHKNVISGLVEQILFRRTREPPSMFNNKITTAVVN